MNTTETTLDAVVLMELISEFAGRTVRFTSHGVDFRGELITVLDRGNGVPTDRRLTVIMDGNKEAITGFRTRIAVEFRSAQSPTSEHNATEDYACTECGHLERGQVPGCSCSGCDDETRAIILNETITHLPDYDGHWKGEAYETHHTYGVQIHRTRGGAERWNAQQKIIRPARTEPFYTPAAGDADQYNELGQPIGDGESVRGQLAGLTSADFVIEIPGPSLACLLSNCANCTSAKCTHDCDQHRAGR